jgi:hypothetical protein
MIILVARLRQIGNLPFHWCSVFFKSISSGKRNESLGGPAPMMERAINQLPIGNNS